MEDNDEFTYELERENIEMALEGIKGYYPDTKGNWIHRDTQVLGYFEINCYNKPYKCWDYLRLYVTIESGYFQGAKIDIDESEYEAYTLPKKTQARIYWIKKELEEVLKQNTMQLRRVAVFSNGEGIYERIHA
jgi:hypothetical protein